MISPETLLVVGIGALIIFGPRKLPELGKSLGQGIREFKRGTAGLTEELQASFKDEAVLKPAEPRALLPESTAPEVVRVAPAPTQAEPVTLPTSAERPAS